MLETGDYRTITKLVKGASHFVNPKLLENASNQVYVKWANRLGQSHQGFPHHALYDIQGKAQS